MFGTSYGRPSHWWGFPKSTTDDTSNGADITDFSHPIKYRSDIDGQRTLAVVPAVLFHRRPLQGKGQTLVHVRRLLLAPHPLLVLTFTLAVGCVWLLEKALQSKVITLVVGTHFGAKI
ncbi:hypothetical protein H257_11926 [Aphanomyces astaci]|uniref:Uncharacterized protein n=1 Tax=Aphanomyces astaci TaxID=112090 RepID=W4G081_APHAT|nr:hypothetical protein H257_11926 [Aphanomyces astaci]ETV73102.1 hypothetical protein H257_11926 [Aphanomyces astaci]|eukprot:XP_009837307.1 hypothetical protein H257_11926 [Aphanomyces astaci]